MHWRSIHGKRLLGDKPLGLPAQKGWEFPRLLIGLPPSPTLWKFAADSVFINAFVNCLLNLYILYHSEVAVSIQLSNKKSASLNAYFSTSCTNVCNTKTKSAYFFYQLSVTRVIIPYHQQKNTFLVFGMRTKVLDTRRWRCYYFFKSFIWQMRLSRKSSPSDDCRELPGGARQ